MKKTNTMGIDPSINSCGIAIFIDGAFEYATLLSPSSHDGEYFEKSYDIYTQIIQLVSQYHVSQITLEVPEYWSVAGFMARESGSLFKLNFVCGMIYTLHATVPMTLVPPRKWKGQLSKSVCKTRLWKKYKTVIDADAWDRLDHNVVDAIGLCHYTIHGRV